MSEHVAGYCPACGTKGTLFVGAGGHITCSLDRCLNPTAVADLLTPEGRTMAFVTDLDRNNVSWAADLMVRRDTVDRHKGSRR